MLDQEKIEILELLLIDQQRQNDGQVDQIKEIRNRCNYIAAIILALLALMFGSPSLLDDRFEKIVFTSVFIFTAFYILRIYSTIKISDGINFRAILPLINVTDKLNFLNELSSTKAEIYDKITTEISMLNRKLANLIYLTVFLLLVSIIFYFSNNDNYLFLVDSAKNLLN